MAKNFRLRVKLSKELYEKLNYHYQFYENWDELIDDFAEKPLPNDYQYSYKPTFGESKDHVIDIKLSSNTLVKFNRFCANFKEQRDALDYMIVQKEKENRFGIPD